MQSVNKYSTQIEFKSKPQRRIESKFEQFILLRLHEGLPTANLQSPGMCPIRVSAIFAVGLGLRMRERERGGEKTNDLFFRSSLSQPPAVWTALLAPE